MRIRVFSRTHQAGIDNDGTVAQRVSRLLDRFRPRIDELEVQVIDVNGPKGGIDRRCAVRAQLDDGSELRARADDSLIPRAIDAALRRVARLIAEHGKRRVAARRRIRREAYGG